MFFKTIALTKFCIFYRKTPVVESCLIKETPTQVFSWEFCKLFESICFIEADYETPMHLFRSTSFCRTSQVAASDRLSFLVCKFIKKGIPAKMFFCEFCKFFKNIFWQSSSAWLLLVYLWTLKSFSNDLFYRASLGNWLFHVQVAEFQPPPTVKKYFTSAFQALYTKTSSSYSKVFIYLKSPKIISEEFNL